MSIQQQEMIEYTIQDVIGYLMDEEGLSMEESMKRFYTSKTFDMLQDPETGLYLDGSSYIYEMYKTEK